MMGENQIAVSVRNATKFYGNNKVLDNLCMTVERGTIYGLLGASGCGKTTLLSCIVGRKNFKSGDVWTLGGAPGTKECGVPGPRVGYMPQEVALVAEFTVQGALYYFGRIYEMPSSKIEARIDYLSDLLELPPRDRYIKECSGGQQRRVSFAVALINSPELLILDEPTVGLDPVLREKIWNHLVEITTTKNVAVIITTHYIEETRQAHKIGLMRNGKLLAEESPNALLYKYNTDSLEEVYLLLSQKQTDGQIDPIQHSVEQLTSAQSTSSVDTIPMKELTSSVEPLTPVSKKKKSSGSTEKGVNRHRLKALFGKNWNQIVLNPSGFMFMMLFPVLECLAFFIAVGTDIKGINLAVVNDERYGNNCTNFVNNETTIANPAESVCYFKGLSCRFLKFIDDPMFNLKYYNNVDAAVEGVKHGHVVGVMHIPWNFSISLEDKYTYSGNVPDYVLNNSQIQARMDMSNRQIGEVIKYKLEDKMKDFLYEIYGDCQFTQKAAEVPVQFEKAVYADIDDLFNVFMLPGVLITYVAIERAILIHQGTYLEEYGPNRVIFFMGATNTSAIIITERLEGIWDRSIVAGVSSLEILISHLVTQFTLLLLQTISVLILTFVIFEVDYIGNFVEIFAMILIQGFCGMTFGFVVSVVSNGHTMANILTTGSFYPMILLCGLVWPIEGMPVVLQWASLSTPFAVPVLSLRNIMKKGWNITHLHVFDGFAIGIGWSILFIIVSLVQLKRTR